MQFDDDEVDDGIHEHDDEVDDIELKHIVFHLDNLLV